MRTDYEALASRYDADRQHWEIPLDDVVAALRDSGAAVRVVDVGCGTGLWLRAQAQMVAGAAISFIGADPSAGMLAEARGKGIANLVQATAEALPLPDATADYVVANYCFHHFVDKERALDEVNRVLAPAGVYRINNVAPEATEGGWLYECFPETVAIDAERFWPATRIAAALDARGFSVESEFFTGLENIPARDALDDAERRVASQLAVLDDAAYERGLARLREVAAVPDATVRAPWARLCLTARRR